MMRVGFGLIVALGMFSGPVNAQVPCTAPFLPVVPDGATATEEQIIGAREQVMNFVRDSEQYQNCLVTYLRQIEAEAARDPDAEVDPQVQRRTNALLQSNGNHLTRVGQEFNDAARAFNEVNFPEESQGDPQSAATP